MIEVLDRRDHGSIVRNRADDLEFFIESLDTHFLALPLQRSIDVILRLPDQIERWLAHRALLVSPKRLSPHYFVSTSHQCGYFRDRSGLLGRQLKVVFELVGFVLANQGLGSGIVDVEQGR